ncbi:putative bifunctional diguanylate cyclase/phosphodiesterase [Candidatus Venteria ishoeyi]|uniref:cyclic-guanylate-specific phosphodiesterase n=1 Tax=Candidatus Venteria ishoeyi TaxID=1899563 RepID=A0A1H6FBC4_9GAMM|nr:EAL domain-containing protein [Candidatus Venteria ishoeyi]MDM8546500.1 EAL domain-containing protein [Candidatus Venteria ishoeyi]SEH06324.1 Phytochrome-like protein cph2 [Candidatus Venteria ishoeyi]
MTQKIQAPKLVALQTRLEQLACKNADLQATLDTISEHHDLVEKDLFNQLQCVKQSLEHLKLEKSDLEISLETITQHADVFEQELLLTQNILEQKVQERTHELETNNQFLQQEIKKRKHIEADLQLAASVFDASNDGIIITDANTTILSVNHAYTRLTGYTLQESMGQDLHFTKSGRHDFEFFQNMTESLLCVGYWSGEIWSRRKTEDIFPGWLSISAVKDKQDRITHYIAILSDNTDQRRSKDRIHHLCYYDALTDLPNRTLFYERLQQSLQRANRNRRTKQAKIGITVLFIDLDNFKAINDVFGHDAGDTLLAEMGQRIQHHIAPDSDTLARLSGDEFTLLLGDCMLEQEAVQSASELAGRILDNLHEPFILNGDEVFITASIGIALSPQDGKTMLELLKNAESAGYNAKRNGRNQYQFFTKTLNNTAHRRLMLQNSLRRALERDQLTLYYQPQWDTFTQKIIGVEALLRWQHPELGAISPAEFIPIAEDAGLILPISDWVMRTACLQNKQWQRQGYQPLRMAINLSAQQFHHDNLLHTLKQTLTSTGLDARWLELEITETAAMRFADKTVEMLQDLKKIGVSLAIDDFGTGYSSLGYLRQFRLDMLKIDGSFIADLASESGKALVMAIIDMAHNLKLKVIAEGIETPQQMSFLHQHRCDFVQGFLFHHPVPAAEINHLLQKAVDEQPVLDN